jgi:hypothetical protein
VTKAPPPLEEQAETFADEMNSVLVATVTDDVAMVSAKVDLDRTVFVVGNAVELGTHDLKSIGTLRGQRFPVSGLDGVSLSATWVFIPSTNGNWLKSWSSSFGLYVGKTPFVRLEVDPNKPEGSWLQAHIHVTAESRLLGYLRGLQRQDRDRLEQLHLPVGGFLFRPGIEDFIEFAIDEERIPGKEGWKEALRATSEDFLRRQFMAMVGRRPNWAREGLADVERRSQEEE